MPMLKKDLGEHIQLKYGYELGPCQHIVSKSFSKAIRTSVSMNVRYYDLVVKILANVVDLHAVFRLGGAELKNVEIDEEPPEPCQPHEKSSWHGLQA